jgi:hydrogenase small subunit
VIITRDNSSKEQRGGDLIPELTRRNFLKLLGALGATTFIQTYRSEIIDVFAQAAGAGVKLVWLQGQSDSGCSISLLQGEHPDIYDAVLKLNVNIAYHPTVMYEFGESASKILHDMITTDAPDVLVVEGAIPTGNRKHACMIGEYKGEEFILEDYLKKIGPRVKSGIAVAVGSCATHGGIPSGKPNPTNAKGLKEILPGMTVVNLPGCPPQGEHILLTLAAVILGIIPELDAQGRPKVFYGRLLHDECVLRGYYDEGKFAHQFGEPGCLYKLGCKGPVTYADCASRKWNGGVNYCMSAGAPCIGCFSLDFPDGTSPFYVPQDTLELDVTKKFFEGLTAGVIAAAGAYTVIDFLGKRKKKEEKKKEE